MRDIDNSPVAWIARLASAFLIYTLGLLVIVGWVHFYNFFGGCA